MTFDPAWEVGYVNANVGVGKNSMLYALLDNYCEGRQDHVLELGVGLGFNIDYWLEREADYRGIEGSATAVNVVHKMYPVLKERVVHGDFTDCIPFQIAFDIVFDRASVAHNNIASIRRCVANIWNALKPGGIFVSCDWFSTSHTEMLRGFPTEEENTRTGYDSGVFRNVGLVHFSSREEIVELFKDFDHVLIQEQLRKSEYAGRENVWSVWDLVMRRPK